MYTEATPAMGGCTKHLSLTGQVSTSCSLGSLFCFLIIFQHYNWICHLTTAGFLRRKVVHLMLQNIHLIGGEVLMETWLSVWRCRVIGESSFTLKEDLKWSSIIKYYMYIPAIVQRKGAVKNVSSFRKTTKESLMLENNINSWMRLATPRLVLSWRRTLS